MEKKASHPKMAKGKLEKIRAKPGKSNAYKYSGVKDYAGPSHTYPIDDLAHAKNALARAHYAQNPAGVKAKVYSKFPQLKKRHEQREGKK